MTEFKRTTKPQDKFLTLEQVADRLIVPPSTVRHWIVTGKLRGFKVGKYWRVRESDVDEFLNRSEFKGSGEEGGNE